MKTAFSDVQEFNRLAGREVGDLHAPEVPLSSPSAAGELLRAHSHLMGALRITEGTGPVTGADAVLFLRARLLIEETAEIVLAMASGSKERTTEVADGLADLIYVALDAAVAFGIDMPPVWDAVQAANLAKFPKCPTPSCLNGFLTGMDERTTCDTCGGHGRVAYRDEGGKVTKPPGWTPPDIAAVLERQRKA